jgi:hypothetical protein
LAVNSLQYKVLDVECKLPHNQIMNSNPHNVPVSFDAKANAFLCESEFYHQFKCYLDEVPILIYGIENDGEITSIEPQEKLTQCQGQAAVQSLLTQIGYRTTSNDGAALISVLKHNPQSSHK